MTGIERALRSEQSYCAAHPVYFVETYVNIEDKDVPGIIVPFELWPAQKEALQAFHDNRLNIALKARQLGITWLALAYAAFTMLFTPGCTVIALSRTEDEAKELIRRMSVILGHMPELVRKQAWIGPTWSSTTMTCTVAHPDGNRSVMQAFPAAAGAGRSFTANLLLLDEWAFQQFAREIWASVFPVINRPTGGKVIGFSTIKRGTLFEEKWVEDNDFYKIFIPWSADPRRDTAWYEKTKKALGDEILSEYPATPEEALTIPGGAFFPEMRAHIHLVQAKPMGACERYISIDYGLDALAALWHMVDAQGNDTVYRELYQRGLIVSEAAAAIRKASGSEDIRVIYAPPDLWNRNRDTGRSTAEIFANCGLPLYKVSNDREQGWLDAKEWLAPITVRDEQTGVEKITARLRILDGAAPNLWRCMLAIQKDEHRPNDAATDPHELTHLPDSLRYFCAGRPCAPVPIRQHDPDDPPEWEDQVSTFLEYGR